MTLPNFLIIGASKSGTTSLYYYLREHPQIYMSPLKETNFFAFVGKDLHKLNASYRQRKSVSITDLDDYRALFNGVTNEIALGEACPLYLECPWAPEKIKQYIPKTKLIAILRNPIDRAYSDYNMAIRNGREKRPFSETFYDKNELDHKLYGHYLNIGFYYEKLKRYYDNFKKEQIRIYLYEDLKEKPHNLLKDIYRFLDVDDDFLTDVSKKYNKGSIPRSKLVYKLLKSKKLISVFGPIFPNFLREFLAKLREKNMVNVPVLTENLRAELIHIYRKDILHLENLIDRDLSAWLEL